MEGIILCYNCQAKMNRGSMFSPIYYKDMKRGWHYECPKCGAHVVFLEGD